MLSPAMSIPPWLEAILAAVFHKNSQLVTSLAPVILLRCEQARRGFGAPSEPAQADTALGSYGTEHGNVALHFELHECL